jgi:23S rRNA pseudouridine1911/1915/1917 synthase
VQKGRRAVTRFRVLARAPGAAWLTVELLTGRTHQIRAHFADAGWPIFGDALYGRREKKPVIQRQALHAFRLAFSHPATGARMACEAPLPADLRAALRLLGLSSAG